MDQLLKHKYQQSKAQVKVWEDKFMIENGRLPSKDDIKNADTSVRHAYKNYISLKTQLSRKSENVSKDETVKKTSNAMEKTELTNNEQKACLVSVKQHEKEKRKLSLDNLNNDCNISDIESKKSNQRPVDSVLDKVKTSLLSIFSETSNSEHSNTLIKPKKDIIPVFNNGSVLKEMTTRLCALKNHITSSAEPVILNANISPTSKQEETNADTETKDVTDLPTNVKNAWGSHLNKTNVKNTGVKKLRERTSSFHFTQKLFSSSKFKTKRNPLKPHVPLRRSKSECFSLLNDSSCDSLDTVPTLSTSSVALSQEVQTPELDLPKIEVVTPSTLQLFSNTKCKVVLKESNQKIKASFQTSSRIVTESRYSLDTDWLNRCTQPAEDPIVDIFAQDRLISKDTKITSNAVKSKVKPDQEDKEKLSASLSPSEKPTRVISTIPTSSLETNIETDVNTVSLDLQHSCDTSENVNSDLDPFADDDNDVVSDSDTEQTQESFLMNRLSKRSASEALSPLPPPVKKKVKVQKAEQPQKPKSAKQENLEKKISQGRINENFVKINIKKKIFVRGRKNTSYSKYKKMMYKKKQVGQGGSAYNTKGACFTCGESGHWSNKCPQKGGLIPVEEAKQIDDSPYLTLEEAGSLADEQKPISRFVPMPQPVAENNDVETENNSTETNPASNSIYVLPPRNVIMPVYPLPDDGSTLIDTPLEVLRALKQFGHKSFRTGQEEAIMRILSGLSSLVMLSTGAGKSLCYQLPAYLFAQRNESCITLVVSPLVSLMEDQIGNLPGPLKGACLHMNQTPKQREQVEEQLKQGILHVLLVSPESVVNSDRQGGIGGILRFLPPIAFACIDEAHCVSQWSHNFRPSYLMLCKVLRERLKVKTILGLTATATNPTALSIAKHLNVPDERIISDMPMPENLVLSISRDSNRDAALITLLQGHRFGQCESIIIYCIRREECERIASLLRTCLKDPEKRESTKKRALSWNAEAYHAGLTAFRRKQVQQHFMSGKIRIVVATVAFGMGINKNNLRAVIHYNMPASFERFVQEVGRAGRDGLPAHCHLFLDSKGQDLNELRRHIYSDSIDRHVIRKLLLRVFKPCKCLTAVEALEKWDPDDSQAEVASTSHKKSGPIICPGHEVAFLTEETVQALDLPEENILTLLCYLELHPNKWVELLTSAYVLCKVSSYGGPAALKAAAKQCPPLAMAVAVDLKAGISHEKSTSIEFNVIEVASVIGWDSGMVKKYLKDLEWKKVNGKSQRSKLVVRFSGPGMRVRARGCLPPEELDEALDWLARRVESQEVSKLLQLEALFLALTSVSYTSCDECIKEVDAERCEKLKASVHKYFNAEENIDEKPKLLPKVTNEDQVRADVSAMYGTFSDTNFTGRAIARIFHGIQSPCYPAHIWGRTKFWRLHLNDNFNTLSRIATTEILRLRA